MELQLNDIEPRVMHIDLNSCYAIIEQQANRLIRHKPVGVAAYDSPGGFIIAASYEAKRLGINLMRVKDAKAISKDIIILTPDPEKYFDAHRRFRRVLEQYTSDVTPKSVDEFIVDFRGSQAIRQGRSLVDVGYQIKKFLGVFKSKIFLVPVIAVGLVAVGAGIGWLTIKDPPVSASDGTTIIKKPGLFEGRNENTDSSTLGESTTTTDNTSTNNTPVNVGKPRPQTTYKPKTTKPPTSDDTTTPQPQPDPDPPPISVPTCVNPGDPNPDSLPDC